MRCNRVAEAQAGSRGRFAILLPYSREAILFGTARLWAQKEDAEFHLHLSRGYAPPQSELHSAYIGEIGIDF